MGSNFILGISSACYVQSMLYKIYFFYGNVGNIIQFSVFMAHSLSLVYIFFSNHLHPFHHPHIHFILYIFFSSPLLLVCLSQADFSVALKKPYQFLVQFSFLSLILLPLSAVSPVSIIFYVSVCFFLLLLAYVSLLKFDDYENWFSLQFVSKIYMWMDFKEDA